MRRAIVHGLLLVLMAVALIGCTQVVGDPGAGDSGFGDSGSGGNDDGQVDGAVASITVNGRVVDPSGTLSRDAYFVDALLYPEESSPTVVVQYTGAIGVTVNGTPVSSGTPIVVSGTPASADIDITAGFETWRHKLTFHQAPEQELTSFQFTQSTYPALPGNHAAASINTTDNQVLIEIPTELTGLEASLVPTFETNAFDTVVRTGGSTVTSGSTSLDFTQPIVLQLAFAPFRSSFSGPAVRSSLEYVETYTVFASATPPGPTELVSFGFAAGDNPSQGWGSDANGDLTGTLVSGADVFIRLPDGSDVTTLVATFATGGGAVTVAGVPQTAGVSAQDFTEPVDYVVADGSTETYTVIAAPADAADVDAVVDALGSLAVGYQLGDSAASVTGGLTLPPSAAAGVAVSWDASDLATVEDDGTVTPPQFHESNESGTLVATLSKGGYSRTLEFDITVIAQGPDLRVRYGGSVVSAGAPPSSGLGTDFGTRTEGSDLSRDFALWNDGNQELAVNSVTVTSSTPFTLSGFTGGTIAAGGSQTLTVTYDSDYALGERTATISISSDDTDVASYTFGVRGLTIPARPGTLSAGSETTTTVDLSWPDDSALNTGYSLRYDALAFTTYDPGQEISIDLGDVTSRTVSGLDPGRTYEFRIYATGAGETSGFTSATTYTVPSAPANVSIRPLGGSGHATLYAQYDDVSLQDYPDLTYEIFTAAGPGEVGTKPGSPSHSGAPFLGFEIDALSEWTEYTIWVDAVTPTGRASVGPLYGDEYGTGAEQITKTYLAPASASGGDAFTTIGTDRFTANWTDASIANDAYSVIYGKVSVYGTFSTDLEETSILNSILGRTVDGTDVIVTDAQAGIESTGSGAGSATSLEVDGASGLDSDAEYHVWVEPSIIGIVSPGTRLYLGIVTTAP